MPGAQPHPQPRTQRKKRTSKVTAGSPELPGIPRTIGFNGLLRALPGEPGFLATITGRGSASLISASGYQDHAASPFAHPPFVVEQVQHHRIPLPTSVTIAKRPFDLERDMRMMKVIWVWHHSGHVRQIGTTGKSPGAGKMLSSAISAFQANRKARGPTWIFALGPGAEVNHVDHFRPAASPSQIRVPTKIPALDIRPAPYQGRCHRDAARGSKIQEPISPNIRSAKNSGLDALHRPE